MRSSQKQHIKQVIVVLLSAVVCASLLAVLMLYRYGPTGHYVAGNALLSPAVIHQVNYKDSHPSTGKGVSFVFNSIEFSYFDILDHQQKRLTVSPEAYEKIYGMIANEQSLLEVTDKIQMGFETVNNPATMMIIMRTDLSDVSKPITKVFQLVQFANTDHFRIQLRGTDVAGEWAYFYHPQIYQEVIKIIGRPL